MIHLKNYGKFFKLYIKKILVFTIILFMFFPIVTGDLTDDVSELLNSLDQVNENLNQMSLLLDNLNSTVNDIDDMMPQVVEGFQLLNETGIRIDNLSKEFNKLAANASKALILLDKFDSLAANATKTLALANKIEGYAKKYDNFTKKMGGF